MNNGGKMGFSAEYCPLRQISIQKNWLLIIQLVFLPSVQRSPIIIQARKFIFISIKQQLPMNESHKLPSSNQKFAFIKSCFSWLEEKSFVILPSIAVLLTLSVVSVYFHYFSGEVLLEHDKWGQFGDYLGGILNPIFGFLGFIALLLTLKLQRQELKLSTEELAKSAKALELQNKSIAQQNFENTFFQLLRRHGELVSETNFDNKTGRRVFQNLFRKLSVIYYDNELIKDTNERAITSYQVLFSDYHYLLAHYFRVLYHVFKFIDTSQLSEVDKSSYANMARAQISSYELCLMFYNGTYGEGKGGFKPLIEKYGLLKHLDQNLLLTPKHKENRSFYEKTAFLSHADRAKFHEVVKTE
jgi:hypothetical protein